MNTNKYYIKEIYDLRSTLERRKMVVNMCDDAEYWHHWRLKQLGFDYSEIVKAARTG
jgi:hypothetical protein